MSDSQVKSKRVYRNVNFNQLSKYHLATPGKVSILHRISGFILFFSLPIILVPLFNASVASEQSFIALGMGFGGFLLKLVLLVLLWGFMHHLCAGIRFLVLDLHIGLTKEKAKKSARLVLMISWVLTVVFAIKMFGAL